MTINHLIIFCKNAVLGKVKTRLAKEVGEENALEIYKLLLEHTSKIAKPVIAQRKCYYADFIENNDSFGDSHFEKMIQKGDDLGERMYNAAKNSFGEWANKVIIIGSDCYDLNSGIIEEAYRALDTTDVVIGPTERGGYYLIGMKDLNAKLFLNRVWSSENVFLDTLLDIQSIEKSHYILPTLSTIENVDDLTEDLKSIL